MKKITDIAKVIRSKNCSPFELTIDIILKKNTIYKKLKKQKAVNKKLIAKIYQIPVKNVKKVIWFDPANAVKITMERLIPSGVPGDSDVYGAQQHGPLLNLKFDV